MIAGAKADAIVAAGKARAGELGISVNIAVRDAIELVLSKGSLRYQAGPGLGLRRAVDNAGISVAGPVWEIPIDLFRKTYEMQDLRDECVPAAGAHPGGAAPPGV